MWRALLELFPRLCLPIIVISLSRLYPTGERMASWFQNVASYVLVMSKKSIDPTKIWLHANGFYTACQILIEIDVDSNPDTAAEIGHAVVALSALNSELFFKCLICIETGAVPHGHHPSCSFSESKPNDAITYRTHMGHRSRSEADAHVGRNRKGYWRIGEARLA